MNEPCFSEGKTSDHDPSSCPILHHSKAYYRYSGFIVRDEFGVFIHLWPLGLNIFIPSINCALPNCLFVAATVFQMCFHKRCVFCSRIGCFFCSFGDNSQCACSPSKWCLHTQDSPASSVAHQLHWRQPSGSQTQLLFLETLPRLRSRSDLSMIHSPWSRLASLWMSAIKSDHKRSNATG